MSKEKIDVPILVAMAGILVMATITVGVIVAGYRAHRDIDSNLYRAQVSANAEDMAEYAARAREAIEARGIDKIHLALILRTPANDGSLIHRSIRQVEARLEEAQGMDRTSNAYNTLMDDLRGTLREIEGDGLAEPYVKRRYWMLIFIAVFGGVSAAFAILIIIGR